MPSEFVRFFDPDSDDFLYGKLEGESITAFDDAPWYGGQATNEVFSLGSVVLKAPIEPSKIVCIGLNYHAHVAASQSADEAPAYPLIFLKPSSAVIGLGESIVHPPQSQRVDYEAELGVVIGREAKNVSEDDADRYIFGLTCVNDVTARDLQKKDGQWSRAKGFDTFCPVGPTIVTDVDFSDLKVEGILNGEVKQSGRTSLMIFKIPYLISYISSIMTLYPGDLISTGTPSGIGPMVPGDSVEVVVENVGRLINPIIG
ncbi:MAG TPA: fumarylacetoacetate hydrolase family protein [candidate division Zixibacteria bacterium]|nr:fumarylacetoacetate hydrolase family protein [candidate division Zixibacteria bacterium]